MFVLMSNLIYEISRSSVWGPQKQLKDQKKNSLNLRFSIHLSGTSIDFDVDVVIFIEIKTQLQPQKFHFDFFSFSKKFAFEVRYHNKIFTKFITFTDTQIQINFRVALTE